MRAPKKLVINADDYGLTKGITDGIVYGLENGYLSDISFITNSSCFDYAADQLKRLSRTSVGIHLTVVDGEVPLADAQKIPLILDVDGRFLKNRNHLFTRMVYARSRVRKQLECEFRCQIEKLLYSNFIPTHIDSHQHIHLFPGVSELVVMLAKEYEIPYIRLPRMYKFNRYYLPVDLLFLRFKRKVHDAGFPFFQFKGMDESGAMNYEKLRHLILGIGSGITEIGVHPGRGDRETLDKYGYWNFDWNQELEAVCDKRLKEVIERKDIHITSFEKLIVSANTSPSQDIRS